MTKKLNGLLILIATLIIIFMCCIVFSDAETTIVKSGSCGENVTYELNSDGVLTISGEGSMYSYESYLSLDGEPYSSSPFFKKNVKKIVIKNGVTSIGKDAFSYCSGLTSIEIPSSVTSIGIRVFLHCTGLTCIEIPNSVTDIGNAAFSGCSGLMSIEIPDGVTSIGNSTFSGCSALENLDIPSSVTSIGDYAFKGCAELTSIEIPSSVISIGEYAFKGCAKLTSIEILSSVTSIGEYAFEGCNRLTELTIPLSEEVHRPLVTLFGSSYSSIPSSLEQVSITDGVTSICNSALKNCTRLTSIEIPSSVTSIGNYAFSGCKVLENLEIPSSVKSIGDNAFEGTKWIENKQHENPLVIINNIVVKCSQEVDSVVIPNNVTSICGCAFEGCVNLTDIEIPRGVSNIGDLAFKGCSGLTELTIPLSEEVNRSLFSLFGSSGSSVPSSLKKVIIPDEITSICDYAFSDCIGLTSIEIPDNVISIGDYAFYRCIGLTSIEIPDNVQSIGGVAFGNCSGLTSIEIPSGVTSIGDSAFYGCSGLTSIKIPDGVTSIGDSVFRNCCGLTNIKISKSATSIGDYAFRECSDLASIEIPDSVTSIGNYAFNDCIGLISIEIPSSVTKIGKYAFSSCTSLKQIKLPKSSRGESILSGCNALEKFEGPGISLKSLFGGKSVPSSLKEIIIIDGETQISETAFSGCSGLTSIKIPNSVTSIGNSAFSDCTSLTSIEIPNSVTRMGYSAFSGCNNLEVLMLPLCGKSLNYYVNVLTKIKKIICTSNEEEIPNEAFKGCTNLKELESPLKEGTLYKLFGSSYSSNPKSLEKFTFVDGETIIADNAFSGCAGLINIEIPDGVTSIGYSAFWGCTGLSGITSLSIPDSVVSIEGGAFSGFVGLKEVKLPANLNYLSGFRGCSGLTSIKIPDGVTSIGDEAFYGCSGLTSIEIPDGVTSIGQAAFCDCSGLSNIKIPDGVKNIYNCTFSSCSGLTSIEIPSSVKCIYNCAFSNCSGLTSIKIPSSVTSIDSNVFNGCSGLVSVEISNRVNSIGFRAFGYCSGLTSIEIPDSVTTIGNEVFYGCTELKELKSPLKDGTLYKLFGESPSDNPQKLEKFIIAGNYRSISDNAFTGCTGLKELKSPLRNGTLYKLFGSSYSSNPQNLEKFTFVDGEGKISDNAFRECIGLKSIEIPSSVTSIGDSAFENCSELTSIEIPSSVTDIGNCVYKGCSNLKELKSPLKDGTLYKLFGSSYSSNPQNLEKFTFVDGESTIADSAFSGCNKLTNIKIPKSISSIGTYAFYGCSGLKEVKLSNKITSVGSYTFYGCSNLARIDILNGVTSLGSYAFSGCSKMKYAIIPDSLKSAGTISSGVSNAIPTTCTLYLSKGCYADTNLFGSQYKKVYFETAADGPTDPEPFLHFDLDEINIDIIGGTFPIFDYLSCNEVVNKDNTIITLENSDYVVYDKKKGLIAGYEPGTCKITAKHGQLTATANINVLEEGVAATAIELNKDNLIMEEGDTERLKVSLKPDNALVKKITWSSSDSSVAKVRGGIVTAMKPGEATITANCNGTTKTVNVTVESHPKEILLLSDKSEYSILKKESKYLAFRIMPNNCEYDGVTFENKSPDLLDIDEDGLMTGKKAGTAQIVIKCGNLEKPVDVEVKEIPVSGISLNKTSLTIEKNEYANLSASVLPSDTTDDDLTVNWKSDDEDIATVDNNGKVTFVDYGKTKVTASIGSFSATCDVICRKPLTAISLNETGFSFKNKETKQLSVTYNPDDTTDSKTVIWSSNDTNVAKVDSNGLVTCCGYGIAVVTAKVGSLSATCNVCGIEVPMEGIEIAADTTEIKCGQTLQLSAVTVPDNSTTALGTVTWTSGNTNIATITSAGKLTAKKDGTVTITAKSGSFSDTINISVSHNLQNVSMKKATTTEDGYLAHQKCPYCLHEVDKTVIPRIDTASIKLSETSYTYDKTAKEPSAVVKDRVGNTLSNGTDYTITYSNNTAAGTASAKIVFCGNYSGSVTKTYNILAKEISKFVIDLDVSEYDYDGNSKTPAVTVKDENGVALANGTDYTVSYSDNLKPGTAKALITFSSNYGSSKVTKEFNIICRNHNVVEKIDKATLTETGTHNHECSICGVVLDTEIIECPEVELNKSSFNYNAKVQSPVITLGSDLIEGTDYILEYLGDKCSVGEQKIKLILMGDKYEGNETLSYNILPKGTKLAKLSPGKKCLTAKWTKQTAKMKKSRITGYQLQYALSKNMKSSVKSLNAKGYSKSSQKISKLKSKKKYFVRIRTHMKVGGKTLYSTWSPIKSVKVK